MTASASTQPAVLSPPTLANPRPTCDLWLAFVDRHRKLFLTLLLLSYLIAFNAQWRIEPDSALYLTLGHNLAAGQGYTYHGQPHALAYPGLPYAFAVLFKLFGPRSLLPHQILMLLLGLTALGLTYYLFLTHADRPTAVMVTIGTGITHTFFIYSFYLLTDMPFLVGVLAFLAAYERLLRHRARWWDWLLLLAGLAIVATTRPTMWAFLPIAGVATAWSLYRKQLPGGRVALASLLILLMLAAIAFLLADPRRKIGALGTYEDDVYVDFSSKLSQHVSDIAHKNLPALFGPITVIAAFGVEMWPLNPVVGILLVALGIGLTWRRPMWGLWIAALVLVMILILPVRRYYLAATPLLVYAWWLAMSWVNRRLPRPWGNLCFGLMLAMGTIPNMLKLGQFFLEQHTQPFLLNYRDGKYAYVRPMAREIQAKVEDNRPIISTLKTGRVLTYLSGKNVLEARDVLPHAMRGRSIYVVVPGDEELKRWLVERQVQLGDVVAEVPRTELKQSPWQLRRAVVGE